MKLNPLILFIVFCTTYLNSQITTDTLDISEIAIRITLPNQVNETSGVAYYNNALYTFNDSGGNPEIYKLNIKDGKILQTIKIQEATNVDWEEITLKDDTLYIGDFGNNLGNRRDLTIYSIKLPDDSISKNLEVPLINKFYFTFEDQKDFKNRGYQKTNFDCEAFVYDQGKLHLFTKQWENNQTTHYLLNIPKKNDSTAIAKKVESFNTECVITGASLYKNELFFIGYTPNGLAYLWEFKDFKNGYFFNGKAKKILLGFTAELSQTEGIEVNENNVYITGEEMNYSLFHPPPTLYILNKSKL